MPLFAAPLESELSPKSGPWSRWFAALVQIVNQTISGSATFASAASVTVTLAKAQLDTQYKVLVTGDANETFRVTDKTKTSFIIRSSNATSTANVDWLLTR